MTYQPLNITEFGRHLLESQDLDPVYVPLSRLTTELGRSPLAQWLLSYWCFYDVGTACFMSEASPSLFWHQMHTAAANVEPDPTGRRWRRAAERRHFRGKQAIAAVNELMTKWGWPERMLDHVSGAALTAPTTCGEVMKRAQENRGFGPWISFKIADMIERLGLKEVKFEVSALQIFDAPLEGASLMRSTECGVTGSSRQADLEWAVNELMQRLGRYSAPPRHERGIGIQEIETILCKWKSHMNGHYPLFKDQNEVRHELQSWRLVCKTASRFLSLMPGEAS